MLKTGFIGAGTVGTALAAGLSRQGYTVTAVASRSASSARRLARAADSMCRVYSDNQSVADNTDLIFITTPDSAITSVVEQIEWHAGQSVVHCSGADSTTILDAARRMGADVGVFHPLQTFADVEQAIANIPGSTFALEAEEPLLSTLKEMATALGGNWIELKAEDKVLYHASAVLVSNYLVTLVKMAADLWQTLGFSQEQAVQSLLPLIRGTVNNIDNTGIPQCLTGPIARGDAGTVSKHLHAIEKSSPGLLAVYRELGLQTIAISLAKGKIDREQAAKLHEILSKELAGSRV